MTQQNRRRTVSRDSVHFSTYVVPEALLDGVRNRFVKNGKVRTVGYMTQADVRNHVHRTNTEELDFQKLQFVDTHGHEHRWMFGGKQYIVAISTQNDRRFDELDDEQILNAWKRHVRTHVPHFTGGPYVFYRVNHKNVKVPMLGGPMNAKTVAPRRLFP